MVIGVIIFILGGVVYVLIMFDLNLKLNTDATSSSDVGNYDITFVSANSNYLVTASEGIYKITARKISISTQQSGYYGDEVEIDNTEYNILSGTVINGDDLNLTMNTTATKTSPVASYDIVVTSTNLNYEIDATECKYRVYRRSIIVIPTEQQFEYGEEININKDAYTIENIVNNDEIDITLSTTATKSNLVGNYEIHSSYTPSNVTSNYNISLRTGNLKIIPRKVTILANQQSSIYGNRVDLNLSAWSVSRGSILDGDDVDVGLSTVATNKSPLIGTELGSFTSHPS